MTDAEIRVAIAKKCGWKQVVTTEKVMHWPGGMLDTQVTRWAEKVVKFGKQNLPLGCVEEDELPDYPNDLNAMFDAEETIKGNPDLWVRWGNELFAVTKPNGDNPFACYHATARQRAEAFCRTLGIWKD